MKSERIKSKLGLGNSPWTNLLDTYKENIRTLLVDKELHYVAVRMETRATHTPKRRYLMRIKTPCPWNNCPGWVTNMEELAAAKASVNIYVVITSIGASVASMEIGRIDSKVQIELIKITSRHQQVLKGVTNMCASSIDFSKKLRDGNVVGIPLGETTHLKQIKDVMGKDDLERLMVYGVGEETNKEVEKVEIHTALKKMIEEATDVTKAQRQRLVKIFLAFESALSLAFCDNGIHDVDFDHFMQILEGVLENIRKWKVRISPSKSIVCTKSIEYCGRILDNGGSNFTKKYYEKMLSILKPEYVLELVKLVHLSKWLTTTVSQIVELRDKTMIFYPEKKGNTKKLQKEKSRIMWNDEFKPALNTSEQCLVQTARKRLQDYDRGMDLILVTGDSNKYHSANIFQASPEERGDNLVKKLVYPIIFFCANWMPPNCYGEYITRTSIG
eukprot:augustus_masked-scaffold_71-processed-gene-0.59-mRNA-1 protein AED:1.00 eAED:1.00 QI:0/0/0/0/1/1/5/0/443